MDQAEATPAAAPEQLRVQREAWERRPVLRALYARWSERIVAELSAVDGPTVELGCGVGIFKAFHPEVVATDVAPSPWTDEVADAERMPYADRSVANLVMTDVLHHLPRPLAFFEEAERALARGGRVVMVEPYCSPLSTPLYRRFHHERTDPRVDAFAERPQSGPDPWDSNQALPTLIFWRGLERYRRLHPRLPLVRRERSDWLVYPLSGGFTGRRLVPSALGRPLMSVDGLLRPLLGPLAAFRCLVVLERR